MQPCGLRDLTRPRGRLSFGLKTGRVAGYARGTLGPKGSKKTFMQPCGLRGLACPRGRRSFGLKARRFAGCARGTLGPKGSKKHSCNPVGCGIWRALGGDSRLASRPGELRAAPAVPLAERGLRNIHATLWAAGFGAPLGATVVWPQGRASCGLRPRYPWPKGSKKTFMQPCGLRDLTRPWGRQSFGLKAG